MNETQTENRIGNVRVLDARPIPCATKHGLIIKTWLDLPVGGHFILLDDHDPVPLYSQFSAQWPGTLGYSLPTHRHTFPCNGMICIHHLFISPGHNFVGHHGGPPGTHAVVEQDKVECVAGQGICGDRYFNFKENYKGQITFFSQDVFEAMRHELDLPAAQTAATRRNVLISGVNLSTLVGAEFEIQGVRFAGVEECRPCYWMNKSFGDERAESWLKGRGGLRARILSDGLLQRGT